MKDITQFADVAGNPSTLGSLDPQGSTVDLIFAEAVVANEPTTILEEAGIIRVKTVPEVVDTLSFPIVLNTQLTWKTISRGASGGTPDDTGSDFGKDFNSSSLNAVTYKPVTPVIKTANIFLPDNVSLMNQTDFNLFTQVAATDAKRKKEEDSLNTLMGSSGASPAGPLTIQGTSAEYNLKIAGGFSTPGSLSTGSTIAPLDLIRAKRDLSTGSDPFYPDFILTHPNQYAQLNTHPDFAPGATSNGAMMRKAKFDENGDIVRFDGMDIYVSEMIPTLTGSDTNAIATDVTAKCVLVGVKGLAIGRGEKEGIKVSTEDSRRRHGQWKIFDMWYDQIILVKDSMLGILASD